MPELTVFFPMAAPSGPVGYARVWVDQASVAEGLPLDNFDVQTVGEAWSAMHAGELFPVAPPSARLVWDPSFLGAPNEVDAGRSKGRSAHLATLLAAAAWRAGMQSRAEGRDLAVWASGELDPEGRLKPVDQLAHKLRIFFEHLAVHGGPGLFVAPAANRTTVDLQDLAGDLPVEERHFSPGDPLEPPSGETPLIVWVNRQDVPALIARLMPASSRHRGPWRAMGVAILAILILLVAGLGIWLSGPRAEPPTGPPAALPAGLEQARVAMYLPRVSGFDLDALQAALPDAREVDGGLVWDDDGSGFRVTAPDKCGSNTAVPVGLRFRFRIDERGVWAMALGGPSDVLAALSTNNTAAGLARPPREQSLSGYYNAQRAFDPRRTLLFAALTRACRRIYESGALEAEPFSIHDLLEAETFVLNAFEGPIIHLYQANACCSALNGCSPADSRSRACPLSTLDSQATGERSFSVTYTAPRNAYLSLTGGADTGERIWAELDGEQSLDCTGPSGTRRYKLDVFPKRVLLGGQRTWSRYSIEFEGLFLADNLEIGAVGQRPEKGIVSGLYPQHHILPPGWTGAPDTLFEMDFQSGQPDPFRIVDPNVDVDGGRLRLVRTAGRHAEASADLDRLVEGDWNLGVTFELLTEQSTVAICLRDTAWGKYSCLALSTKTENQNRKGAHLLCETMYESSALAPRRIAIRHLFDPGAATPHRLKLERRLGQGWRLLVDGILRGESDAECLVKRFDRISLHGFQDSSAGHGGYVDDLVLYRQEFHPIEEPAP